MKRTVKLLFLLIILCGCLNENHKVTPSTQKLSLPPSTLNLTSNDADILARPSTSFSPTTTQSTTTSIIQTTTTTLIPTTTMVDYVFRPKGCTDYLSRNKDGGFDTLSHIIGEGMLRVVSTTSLKDGVKEGITVKQKDVEITNKGGILDGYFTVFNKKDDVVASSLNVTMTFYEVKNLTGENYNQLYKQDLTIDWKDFKEILTTKDVLNYGNSTIQHNYPEIGYYFNDTRLGSFDKQPSECLGLVTLNYTNNNGQTFSGSTLFLFNDVLNPECTTDTDCTKFAGLCKNSEFRCLFPNLPVKGLENATCSCIQGYCSTNIPDTSLNIIDGIVFKSGTPIGLINNLMAG